VGGWRCSTPRDWRVSFMESAPVAGDAPHRALVAGDAPHHGGSNCYTGSGTWLPIGPALEDGEPYEQADASMHPTRTPAPAMLDSPAACMPMDSGPPGSFRAKLTETKHKHAGMQARNASGACAQHTPAVLFPAGSRLDYSFALPRMRQQKKHQTPRANTESTPRRETDDEPSPSPAEILRIIRDLRSDNAQFAERQQLCIARSWQ